jgi:hypothetical protein
VNQYKLGTSVRFTNVYTQAGSGAPVNPPSVACTAHSPSGASYTVSVVNDSVGAYHADFLIPMTETAGIWISRWVAVGGIPSQDNLVEEQFQVVPLGF